MMSSTILAAALLSLTQAPTAQSTVSPKDLLAKSIARYSSAGTIRGAITMTQTANGKSVIVETGLQVQKPLKVYLQQVRKGGEPGECLVTSDGRSFSYPPIPSNVLKMKRSVEPFFDQNGKAILNVDTGKPLGLSDMYVATNSFLVDKNIWLDMAFGELSHLKAMTSKWATLQYRGRVKSRGVEVHAISGDWRETNIAVPSGEFELYINDDNDIIRYVVNERIAVPNVNQAVQVSTVWDADLRIGTEVDTNLFRLIQ
jgi:hypothetical protein